MKLIDSQGNKIEDIRFGVVPVGETQKVEYALVNDNGTEVTSIKIGFEGDNSELFVEEAPEYLENGERGLVKISWTPSLKVKEGLHAKVCISGMEIYK